MQRKKKFISASLTVLPLPICLHTPVFMDHSVKVSAPLVPPSEGHDSSRPAKRNSTESSWAQPLVMVFLTFNSVTAVYRSIGDPWTVTFIVTAYLDLILLFYCLRALEKRPDRRGPLKIAVWSLSTILTVMFSYRVAAIMPPAMKAAVWCMAGATVCAGFYAFFLFREKGDGKADGAAAAPALSAIA